jgi:Protein of unknown function (DUF3365)
VTMKKSVFALAVGALFTLPSLADQAQYDSESRQLVQSLTQQLGGALKKEMEAGGPGAAIAVCRDLAPKLTNQLSLEKGLKLTRVGTRVRNPMIGTPDAWEQETLAQFEKRLKQGEKLDAMEFSQVVDEPAGKSYRYMKAIGVQPVCVTCHGKPEDIPSAVKDALAKHYPHDRATGYSVGQLRGAVSIKRPL